MRTQSLKCAKPFYGKEFLNIATKDASYRTTTLFWSKLKIKYNLRCAARGALRSSEHAKPKVEPGQTLTSAFEAASRRPTHIGRAKDGRGYISASLESALEGSHENAMCGVPLARILTIQSWRILVHELEVCYMWRSKRQLETLSVRRFRHANITCRQ